MKLDRGTTLFGIFLLFVLGFFLLEWSRPRSLDWSYSYSKEHSRPYGCEILYKKLPTLFPDRTVRSGEKTLSRAQRQGDLEDASIILIGEQIGLNRTDRELLMEKVRDGGRVFIAARSIDRPLLDSLGVEMKHVFSWETMEKGATEEPKDDTVRLDLEKAETPSGGFPFFKGLGSAHFRRAHPHSSDILGRDDGERMVYVRAEWGDGAFYLHSKPLSFTNYYLTQEASYPYAFKALSHLPVDDIYWDEHYKPFRKRDRADPTQTPFRFLLQHPSLRAALWILALGVLLILTFGAKRGQRAMPVVHPPRNSTLSYVGVLGRLHFEDGGHQRIARMRAQQFLRRVERKSGMQIEEKLQDKEVQKKLARTMDVDEELTRACMLQVDRALKSVTRFGQRGLLALEKRIHAFWEEEGKKS